LEKTKGKAMAEVIVFPKVLKEKISEKTKLALKMEMQKARVEQSLNTVMMSDHWEAYTITVEDFEMMALCGEVMKFDPKAASRLISKLADFVKRMSVTYEDLI
jgi:PHD/YefM family antitoxin component YafN of YafNO toxin-antitoxin module|tara:strand:- start:406 stop:714 length:309 start_codon:yes stop_codon:yes gene_type:complete